MKRILLVLVSFAVLGLCSAQADSQSYHDDDDDQYDHDHYEYKKIRIHYWDLLMNNPRGAHPIASCPAFGEQGTSCSGDSTCSCANAPGAFCDIIPDEVIAGVNARSPLGVPTPDPWGGKCCDGNKKRRWNNYDADFPDVAQDVGCTSDDECCSNNCQDISENGVTCCPPGTGGFGDGCDADIKCCNYACDGTTTTCACFSATSTVNIKESPTPVTMRELKTGQHVECLSSGDDFLAPSTTQYCEVMAWIHAADSKINHQRITFKHPDGTPGSITVSQTHMVYQLSSNAAVGAKAASVADFGAFELVKAIQVKAGDKVVVKVKGEVDKAGFAVVTVQDNKGVRTEGLYLPVIEQPYLVVDGVVMPLWMSIRPPVVTPNGQAPAGVSNALVHMLFSSLFMQRMQPVDTPGLKGQWDGKALFPGVKDVLEKMREKQGMAVDLTKAQKLFKPKYDAWRAARASSGREAMPEVSFDRALSSIDKVLVPAKN